MPESLFGNRDKQGKQRDRYILVPEVLSSLVVCRVLCEGKVAAGEVQAVDAVKDGVELFLRQVVSAYGQMNEMMPFSYLTVNYLALK